MMGNNEIQVAIEKRSFTILKSMGKTQNKNKSWLLTIEQIIESTNCSTFAWLAITGCYPTKYQLQKFDLNRSSSDLATACQAIILERLKNVETAKLLFKVELESPNVLNLVDITHTFGAPYLTGIQRVVRKITEGQQGIQTFIWVGNTGIIKMKNFSELHSGDTLTGSAIDWRSRVVKKLHTAVPILDSSNVGRLMKRFFLPFARRLKRHLIVAAAREELKTAGTNEVINVLILGKRLTLPEIPSELSQIASYEALLETNSVHLQVILYDFIPFFHAWTVHPGNRGHYNSYIRVVLLANRIISISSLVDEQAKLIASAFKLERNSWNLRKQEFSFLPLPSGLAVGKSHEFTKERDLVVMIGSIEPRKNHLFLLAALELLAKRGIYPKARILGTAGWENDNILDRISALQSKGIDIEIITKLQDIELRDFIGKAQVVLQLSEAEGFGLPIVEALALGTKVVVANIAPLNEWTNERVLTVELGDVPGLSNLIAEIISNPEEFSDLFLEGVTWKDWAELLYS